MTGDYVPEKNRSWLGITNGKTVGKRELCWNDAPVPTTGQFKITPLKWLQFISQPNTSLTGGLNAAVVIYFMARKATIYLRPGERLGINSKELVAELRKFYVVTKKLPTIAVTLKGKQDKQTVIDIAAMWLNSLSAPSPNGRSQKEPARKKVAKRKATKKLVKP